MAGRRDAQLVHHFFQWHLTKARQFRNEGDSLSVYDFNLVVNFNQSLMLRLSKRLRLEFSL